MNCGALDRAQARAERARISSGEYVTGPTRIASIGECMIELRHLSEARLDLAFGGDTFNTAAYLARLAGDTLAVDYVTALGDDPYSAAMRAAIAAEGVGTGLIAALPGRSRGSPCRSSSRQRANACSPCSGQRAHAAPVSPSTPISGRGDGPTATSRARR